MIKLFEVPFMNENTSDAFGPLQTAEINLQHIEDQGWKIISVVGKDRRLIVITRGSYSD